MSSTVKKNHKEKGKIMPEIVSTTQVSNIYTMGICEQTQPLQRINDLYVVPNEQTRLFRAKLLMEEVLETLNAMGVSVSALNISRNLSMENLSFNVPRDDQEIKVDLLGVIDGCCDVNYVSVGILTSFGVPDAIHQSVVDLANMKKFPNQTMPEIKNGKYQKPPGWKDPRVMHMEKMDLVKALKPSNFLHFSRFAEWRHSEFLKEQSHDVVDFIKRNTKLMPE